MRQHADREARQGNDVRLNHAGEMTVVVTNRPGQHKERDDAHSAGNQRRRLPPGLKRGADQKDAEQAEQHRAMPHQDGEVRLGERHALQRKQPVTAERSGERRQMNDAHQGQHH